MTNKPIKAIGYCRVATARQSNNNVAFEAQRHEITRVAAVFNFEIVAWFRQVDSAACSQEDAVLQEALDYCIKDSGVRYVLATEASRISRSKSGFRHWEDSFFRHGVMLYLAEMHSAKYFQKLIDSGLQDSNRRSLAIKRAKKDS